MAKFLKVLSIIVLVLGSIGTLTFSIALGLSVKFVSNNQFYKPPSFNIAIFLIVFIWGALSTVVFYGILAGLGAVLEKTENSEKKLAEINSILEKEK